MSSVNASGPADSPITGETPVDLGTLGRCTLRYDWRAQAQLQPLVSECDLAAVLAGHEPERFAAIVAVGLRRHHPTITAERLLDVSPPLTPVARAVVVALNRARFGRDTPPPAPATEGAEASEGGGDPLSAVPSSGRT